MMYTSEADTCCQKNFYQHFDVDKIELLHLNVKGLPYESKRSFISGCLTATRVSEGMPLQRSASKYMIQSVPVCRKLFSTVYDISYSALFRLSSLRDRLPTSDFFHFGENRGGCQMPHRIEPNIAVEVVQFLIDLGEKIGLPDPGRHRRTLPYGAAVLLPHCLKITKMYQMYIDAYHKENEKPLSLPSFKTIWREALPNLKIMSLRSDMCSTCSRLQNLMRFLMAGGNPNHGSMQTDTNFKDLDSVANVIEALQVHRKKAAEARQFYRLCQNRARESFKNRRTVSGKQHVSLLMIRITHNQLKYRIIQIKLGIFILFPF